MAYLSTESLAITTAAGGGATVYTAGSFNGFLHAIVYTPHASTPFADNVVVTVTGATSGIAIWTETLGTANVAATRYPRAASHTILGAAALYAAAGVAVLDRIPLSDEAIKVVIVSGGNTKVGTLRFLVGG